MSVTAATLEGGGRAGEKEKRGKGEDKEKTYREKFRHYVFPPKYCVYFLKTRAISFTTRIQLSKGGN